MLRFIYFLFFILFGTFNLNAQNVYFSSEVTAGNRSLGYQHLLRFSFNDRWSVNNLTLIDNEYDNNSNNLHFVRNTVSYSLNNKLSINLAFGSKNPGGFSTSSLRYFYQRKNFNFSYVVGATYQKNLTLEQSFAIKYQKRVMESFTFFTSVFAVINTNLHYIGRGLQQIRIGFIKEKIQVALAMNLDQFYTRENLQNIGIAMRYNLNIN